MFLSLHFKWKVEKKNYQFRHFNHAFLNLLRNYPQKIVKLWRRKLWRRWGMGWWWVGAASGGGVNWSEALAPKMGRWHKKESFSHFLFFFLLSYGLLPPLLSPGTLFTCVYLPGGLPTSIASLLEPNLILKSQF